MKRWKIGFTSLIWGMMTISPVMAFPSSAKIMITQRQPAITDNDLQDIASQINKGLPVEMDEDFRWDSLIAEPERQLTFNFTVLSPLLSGLNAKESAQFQKVFQEAVIEMTCKKPEIMTILQNNVMFKIYLRDQQQRTLSSFKYGIADCPQGELL